MILRQGSYVLYTPSLLKNVNIDYFLGSVSLNPLIQRGDEKSID